MTKTITMIKYNDKGTVYMWYITVAFEYKLVGDCVEREGWK